MRKQLPVIINPSWLRIYRQQSYFGLSILQVRRVQLLLQDPIKMYVFCFPDHCNKKSIQRPLKQTGSEFFFSTKAGILSPSICQFMGFASKPAVHSFLANLHFNSFQP